MNIQLMHMYLTCEYERQNTLPPLEVLFHFKLHCLHLSHHLPYLNNDPPGQDKMYECKIIYDHLLITGSVSLDTVVFMKTTNEAQTLKDYE